MYKGNRSEESRNFTKKKRNRTEFKNIDKYSDNKNIKIKLRNTLQTNYNLDDLQCCTTVTATEEDFSDPISFFEKISNEYIDTGIIKIIPPTSWTKNASKNLFEKNYFPSIKTSQKQLEIRIQTLNKLFEGKVKYCSNI
jgi:hypothetical protein